MMIEYDAKGCRVSVNDYRRGVSWYGGKYDMVIMMMMMIMKLLRRSI